MDLSEIKFNSVLSTETTYGIIWSGTYNNKPCAIKMLVLTSGIHYDKAEKKYRDGNGKKITNLNNFEVNDEVPFLHTDYKKKKALPPAEFQRESRSLSKLGNLGLSPKLYTYGVVNRNGIDYGFIVMEKVDTSLKSLLMSRSLTSAETDMVNERIDEFHHTHGIIHGDMKPSNIGVFLDSSGYAKRMVFYDCGKVKYRDNISKREFSRLVDDDRDTYARHIIKNKKAAQEAK